MSIKIGDGYGGRTYSYGYGKHTSYAAKMKKLSSMLDNGTKQKQKMPQDTLLNLIIEATNVTVNKTIVGGDSIWQKIKNTIFKDDHADKNYRR